MHAFRLVPVLVLFLLLTSGQFLQLIERAYAACCPAWKPNCVNWSSLVYGSAEALGTVSDLPLFRITDDKGFSKDIKGNQDLFDAFKNENITKDFGFSIVKNIDGEPTLIAFVPVDPIGHKPPADRSPLGGPAALQLQNKEFQKVAQPPTKGKS